MKRTVVVFEIDPGANDTPEGAIDLVKDILDGGSDPPEGAVVSCGGMEKRVRIF